nr:cuticle protein 19.8-like [Lepeophtheirus salmonis]
MIGKFLIVCLAVTCALADKPAPPAPVYYRPYPPPPPPPTTTTTTTPAPPESSVDFSADELAENGVVSGSYKVVLPDGRIKTVTYTVEGDSGFVADVQFETTPAPAPAPYPKYVPYHA